MKRHIHVTWSDLGNTFKTYTQGAKAELSEGTALCPTPWPGPSVHSSHGPDAGLCSIAGRCLGMATVRTHQGQAGDMRAPSHGFTMSLPGEVSGTASCSPSRLHISLLPGTRCSGAQGHDFIKCSDFRRDSLFPTPYGILANKRELA